jgi:hypothetical protein
MYSVTQIYLKFQLAHSMLHTYGEKEQQKEKRKKKQRSNDMVRSLVLRACRPCAYEACHLPNWPMK